PRGSSMAGYRSTSPKSSGNDFLSPAAETELQKENSPWVFYPSQIQFMNHIEFSQQCIGQIKQFMA
ncbi:hypothetical protein, partial [Acidithiobacillus thiooxidans]|uniref:hypothetical protein n=1 Tax=Acidithiobacillus thiooxidans TaxID=930 RepID=UPI001A7E054F